MSVSPWLRKTANLRDGDALVVCFPFAGGSAASFRPLSHDLPAGWCQVGVELPGRGARFGEQLVPDLDAAAAPVTAALLDLGDVPLILFGHSLGALLAYEVTCRLEEAGRGPRALIASGNRAPVDVLGRPQITDLPEPEFRAALLELDLVRPELFEDPDIAEIFVPVLRGDLQLCEQYPWGRSTKVRAPLTVTSGLDDPLVPVAALHQWTRLAAGPVEVEQLPGGHMYATDWESGLGQLIARVCAETESAARPGSPGNRP
jgi:surfactin synthase thioesterase subunit